jgi:hypothetical protein
MPSTTSLWRPALFGAAGTGFKDDAYLTDGQHLRWHLVIPACSAWANCPSSSRSALN